MLRAGEKGRKRSSSKETVGDFRKRVAAVSKAKRHSRFRVRHLKPGSRLELFTLRGDTLTPVCVEIARQSVVETNPLRDELFPAKQARMVTLLVERVDLGTDGLNVRLRIDGLAEQRYEARHIN